MNQNRSDFNTAVLIKLTDSANLLGVSAMQRQLPVPTFLVLKKKPSEACKLQRRWNNPTG